MYHFDLYPQGEGPKAPPFHNSYYASLLNFATQSLRRTGEKNYFYTYFAIPKIMHKRNILVDDFNWQILHYVGKGHNCFIGTRSS